MFITLQQFMANQSPGTVTLYVKECCGSTMLRVPTLGTLCGQWSPQKMLTTKEMVKLHPPEQPHSGGHW